MVALENTSAYSDGGFLAAIMPNPGRTRFVRGVVVVFLAIGALGCISIAVRAFSEFYARHSWPVAPGQVTAVNVKSYTGPSTRDHVSHYFVEYEVRFSVPAAECLTGTTFAEAGPAPLCAGIVRTRTTDSQALANRWAERHHFNPEVGVLHDPEGPGVKIAGEPPSIVYPWRDIVLMSGWMVFFLIALGITQRRLRYLERLPTT
jgi:hypothetical protein